MNMNNRYDKFDKLSELLKLDSEELIYKDLNIKITCYGKLVFKGDLDFGDYGAGAFNLEIHPVHNYEAKNNADEWQARLWIATVDDGDMGGWAKIMPLEQAQKLCDKIAQEVIKDIVRMPTLGEFNEILQPYGMYVGYE